MAINRRTKRKKRKGILKQWVTNQTLKLHRNVPCSRSQRSQKKQVIDDKYLEQYGKYKAKIDYNLLKDTNAGGWKTDPRYSHQPTPAGEGKTTTSVGLVDGLSRIGKKAMVALREPSLGPVFGVKRRSSRRRIRTGCSYGRYQPSLHR